MSENPVHIGEVIVHGIVFDPKNGEALRTMNLDDLYKSIPRLFELLDERGVEYVLVGGIAMLAYVEGRNTQDVDLIVAARDLEKIPEIKIEDRNPQFARGWLGDLRVDFLFTDNQIFQAVKKMHVTTKRFVERDVPCATVEGLLLLKLSALPDLYRQGQFAKVDVYEKDVVSLLRLLPEKSDAVIRELAKYMLASDVDEVRKIVAEIEDRIAKQAQRFGGKEAP